ncbi:hypothetical protein AHAT_27810 [Agarivorans sp. Toyoura001]|nr:hypothetical protein AHAT_27810 [Agarivorans sp. Toyoura001]
MGFLSSNQELTDKRLREIVGHFSGNTAVTKYSFYLLYFLLHILRVSQPRENQEVGLISPDEIRLGASL